MALTRKEINIARLMINPEKIALMDAVENGDASIKPDVEAFRQKRLSELTVDKKIYEDLLVKTQAEIDLLS